MAEVSGNSTFQHAGMPNKLTKQIPRNPPLLIAATVRAHKKKTAMARQLSIKAQLKRAEDILPKIEAEYNDSLHKKHISEDLKLDIQTFCGHLRSALDYLAKDIVERHCPNAKSNDRFYFPITSDNTSFIKLMTKSYPDLIINCPDIFNFLESIQPYVKNENRWLTQFNEVNNENKHNDLVEQTRSETRTVTVTRQDVGSASWRQQNVIFGNNVEVMGVPIDPRTQLPVQNNLVKTEIITWIDFKFNNINVSALWLLKESIKQIDLININITKYL